MYFGSPFLHVPSTIYYRGLAGTVLVYKIAGALAHRGASLEEVYDIAQWVASRIGTIGVGLEHCHVSLLSCFLWSSVGRILISVSLSRCLFICFLKCSSPVPTTLYS